MKKRIFGMLLMGAMVVASMSMFTSCKDYDDDINKLQTQIDAITAQNLQTQLTTLQAALTKAQADASAAQKAVDDAAADAKKAQTTADGGKSDAATAQKAAEDAQKAAAAAAAKAQEVDDLKTAIADLQKILDGKVSSEDLEKAVKDLEAKITAINDKLLTLDDVKKLLADQGFASDAVVKDLVSQVNALKAYKAALEKAGLAEATVADQVAKINAAITTLNGLTAEGGTIAAIKDLANKANDAANAVTDQINILNVLVNKRLTSLVTDPQFFWGGIETVEAPRLSYRPLKYNKAYDATKPYNAFDQTGTLITVTYASNNDTYKYLPIEADYFMNPSSADVEYITDVTALSADKKTYTRAAACNPTVLSYSAKNGVLSAKIAVDWNKIANVNELETHNGFATEEWDATNQVWNFIWHDTSFGQTVTTQEGEVSILALQAHVKGEEADTTVTSDFAAIAPSNISNFRIVDNCPTANWSDNCYIPNVNWMFHVYTTEFSAIDNGYTHDLVWNDQNGINLDDIVEVHATRSLNVISGAWGEIQLKDLKERYGLELKYELINWTSGENKTEESSKHATLDGSILKASGINGVQTKASIGREPLVKIELVDTNNKNALVAVGYIKFQIVGEKAPDVTVKTYEATTYYLCGGATSYIKWSDVEGDILANNEIVQDGVSKTTFESVYAIAQGSDGSSQSSINWNGDQVGTTYILVDNKWVPYAYVSGYNDDLMNYVIGYHAGVYDQDQQQTNVFGVSLTKEQENYLLAKRSGDAQKPYLKANGQTTADWTEAALNTETTITIAVRLLDQNKSGYPDIYVPFKLNLNTLRVTLNKIPEYWYAANSVTAKSGVDEIHVNVDVVGEPNSVVSHFAGDLFSTIYKNNFQLAAKPAWDTTVGKANGMLAADGYAISEATRTQITNDGGLKITLAFKQGTQASGDNTVNVKGKIVNGASGSKYFVYPRTNTILAAYRWDATNKVISGASKDIVTIENSAITGITAYKTVFTLNNAAQNKVLEDILNYASHKDLANSLTATVGMTVKEGDCQVPVILTNPNFDVKFLRPLNPVGAADKEFTDAVDGGNKLNIIDLLNLTDWRDQWSAIEYDDAGKMKNDSYWTYYQVTYITPDIANITTTMGGGTLGSTKLTDVSSQVQVTYSDAGSTHLLKDGTDFGTLLYTNNNNTVTEFTIRVPLQVGYYWAKKNGYGMIRTYVDIKVKNTKNN